MDQANPPTEIKRSQSQVELPYKRQKVGTLAKTSHRAREIEREGNKKNAAAPRPEMDDPSSLPCTTNERDLFVACLACVCAAVGARLLLGERFTFMCQYSFDMSYIYRYGGALAVLCVCGSSPLFLFL